MANEEEVEERSWQLPPKFHLSKDRDQTQDEILAACDAQQAEWKAKFAQAGNYGSNLDRERGRALIIIDEYQKMLTNGYRMQKNQREELGEAYAAIGRYDLAYKATGSKELRTEYTQIWNAIQRNDSETCDCGTGATFVKKEVWSIFHKSYVSVVKCGQCGHMNAIPTPDHIITARAVRAKIREDLSGLHPLEAKEQMKDMRLKGEIA